MIFNFLSRGKTSPAQAPAPLPAVEEPAANDVASTTPHSAPEPVQADAQPAAETDAGSLNFSSTAELEPLVEPIGQEAAIAAIMFGLEMEGPGYNLIVSGPAGSGKRTLLRHCLAQHEQHEETARDWVYVPHPGAPGHLQVLALAPGEARRFAGLLDRALDDLSTALAQIFASDDFRMRRLGLEEAARLSRERPIDELKRRAETLNIAVLKTPRGYALAPMYEGRVVKPDVLNALPEALRKDVEQKISQLEDELANLLRETPHAAVHGEPIGAVGTGRVIQSASAGHARTGRA